jgi:hypothetical protein
MPTFYTAPPIYNTGGWGQRGTLPTFDPTGIFIAPPNSGIARSFVGVVDYKANVPLKSTESTAASDLQYGLRYIKGKNTIGQNLQYSLSYIKVKNIPNLNLNYFFGESRDVKSSFHTDINYFSTVPKPQVSKSETEINYFSSPKDRKVLVNREIKISHITNSKHKHILNRENISKIEYFINENPKEILSVQDISDTSSFYSKFHKEAISDREIMLSRVTDAKLKGRLKNINNTEINNFAASITRRLESYANIGLDLFPASITRRLYSSTDIELNLFPASITRRVKSDREVVLYNVRNGSHRFKNERSAEANLFSASISRRATFNKELKTEYYRKALSENFSTRNINLQYNLHFSKFKNTTKPNINYFREDGYEGVSSFFNKINLINYDRKDTGKFKNNKNISTINYYNIDSNRGSFTKDDSLNLINYNSDPVPKEGRTESSFPTGVDFPKIRYQSIEPDYSKQSTGSATYGVLNYEGVANGNLFYYEPDQDSFKWEYFDYGVRSGLFDPCEFPETADRTLDPIQISSKSNKKDNPFWYLPDLLTVDSTIHTADGAPCQYIAQENSRYAAIYMEPVYSIPGDPSSAISEVDVLHPENFTQPGVAFTV